MKLTQNSRNYNPLIIPINKPFSRLNEEDAKEYFDWFISHVDERSDYLSKKVSESLNLPIELLDFSMESLIYIWRWFLKVAEINKTPKYILHNIRKELKACGHTKEFIKDTIRQHSLELNVFSRYVIRDIGMYVGKMFVTNFPALRWDYHTDTNKDSFANIPQIFGFVDTEYSPPFEPQFEPIYFTEMQASKLFDKSCSEKDLYDLCMLWTKWIPDVGQN